jgi:hypothetical protein
MIATLLRFFGYAKVPQEAVELASRARMTWEKDPAHPIVGVSLKALEQLMRSTK